MSILGNTISDIILDFKVLSFPQSTVDSFKFDLFDSRKKAGYIRAIEQVYFSYSLFFSLLNSMRFSFEKLEKAKEIFTIESMHKMSFSQSQKLNQEITAAWQIFFLSITTMLSVFKDIPSTVAGKYRPLISDADFCNDYPELNYCRLLRNDFMQHPSLYLGMQSSHSFYSSDNPDFLPYYTVGPDGYGLVIYFTYFQNKVGKKFCKLNDDQKKEKNKVDYMNFYGWKPQKLRKKKTKQSKRVEQMLIVRIKAFGLPPVDQNKLAIELSDLFKNIVFPYLKRKRQQAKKWNFLS